MMWEKRHPVTGVANALLESGVVTEEQVLEVLSDC
jgi:hypothetical protein